MTIPWQPYYSMMEADEIALYDYLMQPYNAAIHPSLGSLHPSKQCEDIQAQQEYIAHGHKMYRLQREYRDSLTDRQLMEKLVFGN